MRRVGIAVILAALCGCDADPGVDSSTLPDASGGSDLVTGEARAAQRRDPTVAVYARLDGRPLAEIHLARAADEADDDASRTRPLTREFNALNAQHDRLTPFLESLDAQVVAHHMRLANAIQVLVPENKLAAIEAHPEVIAVEPVTLFERSNAQAAVHIGAAEVWQRAMATGEGVTVGILDSGIDYFHAHFGGEGTKAAFDANDETIVEDGSFPTEKVIGGWDFVGNVYNPWAGTAGRMPAPDPDPVDCGGHGSHVAGTVAGYGVLKDGQTFLGSYAQTFLPSDFRVGPGMAPLAQLYALKVFGCDGPTEMIAPALEKASDPNGDGDFSDRLDVVNASLGAGYGLGSVAERTMVNNLAALGTVFVAAAGNDGSDGRPYFSVGAPAVYEGAFSVAATLNRELAFSALRVDSPASLAGLYPIAEADFSTPLTSLDEMSEALVAAEPTLACSPLTNADKLAGKVAIVRRGDCMFVDKVDLAAKAGAVAAIVVDNVESDTPFNMAGPGSRTAIPAVLIRRRDGELLISAGDEIEVTLGGALEFPETLGPDYVASFSSRGPNSRDGGLKPEISAPGNSIASASVGSGSGVTRMAGTSMASPVVAGAVALAMEAHPDYTPREIKAVIMGTAASVESFFDEAFPISLSGAGRIQVDSAVRSTVVVMPTEGDSTALAFGAVNVVDTATETREVSVENRGSEPVTFEATTAFVRDLPGVSLTVEPGEFTVPAGETQLVSVDLVVDANELPPPAPDGLTPGEIRGFARNYLVEQGGWVRFTDTLGVQNTSIAFQAIVRGAGELAAGEIQRCDRGGESKVRVSLSGASPLAEQWTSAFQLLAKNPATGIRALGIATDAQSAGWGEGNVYIGVALDEEWTTPARGQITELGLSIDVGGDGRADFRVQPSANSPGNEDAIRQGAEIYADVLVARLSSIASGDRVSDQALNVLTPDLADTRVFFSNLIVFPVSLKDLGVTEDVSTIEVAVTRGALGLPSGGYYRAELSKLALTSESGSPLSSTSEGALRLMVDADAAELPLLLFHHSNTKDHRVEVVDLPLEGWPPSGKTNVRVTGRSKPLDGGRGFEVRVSNDSEALRTGVWLKAWLEAGENTADAEVGKLTRPMWSPDGACSVDGAEIYCDLRKIEAKSQATVRFGVTGGSEDVTVLRAEVGSDLDCEVDAITVVQVRDADSDAPPSTTEASDCGCSTQTSGNGRFGLAGMAGFLALVVARRRRRVA